MAEEHKRRATFSEAQGLKKPPERLASDNLSPLLRTRMFNAIFDAIDRTAFHSNSTTANSFIREPWVAIFRAIWNEAGMALDRFSNKPLHRHVSALRNAIDHSPYNEALDYVQFILRHRQCPLEVREAMQAALVDSGAAYILIDGDTFVPAGSPEETHALIEATEAAREAGIEGARVHLRKAGECAVKNDVGGCLRESIHAANAAAEVVSGESQFGKALAKLANQNVIDGHIRKSIEALYNLSNQEPGARHSLKSQSEIALEMEEALYAMYTCAAFVSYVITRGLKSGVFKP